MRWPLVRRKGGSVPFSAQATYVDTREVAEASVNGAVYVVRNG